MRSFAKTRDTKPVVEPLAMDSDWDWARAVEGPSRREEIMDWTKPDGCWVEASVILDTRLVCAHWEKLEGEG